MVSERGRSPHAEVVSATEGQSHILTTGGEAVTMMSKTYLGLGSQSSTRNAAPSQLQDPGRFLYSLLNLQSAILKSVSLADTSNLANMQGMLIRLALMVFGLLMFQTALFAQTPDPPSQVSTVLSRDGTRIALECKGKGPSLLIVHGGTGDRQRWTPLLPLFASRFTVCAMDRRGHGDSEPGSNYSLQKESEDVAAAVNAQPGPVFVLGHSIGGVFALEAAFVTKKIFKLVLYEPPLQDLDHTAVADRMEQLIQSGNREEALLTFLREIVMMSPNEVEILKARPAWPTRVAGIDIQIREIRALSKYRFDARRTRKLKTPTLLLAGSNTASRQLKQALKSLMGALPNRTLFVFQGEEHNAMDTVPQQFAEVVMSFLQAK
jgi:pimeloyl-ACP methyl ester carboxylesterase